MIRLTPREWEAILCALNRALAGEPETDDEDREGMESARSKILGATPRLGARGAKQTHWRTP